MLKLQSEPEAATKRKDNSYIQPPTNFHLLGYKVVVSMFNTGSPAIKNLYNILCLFNKKPFMPGQDLTKLTIKLQFYTYH